MIRQASADTPASPIPVSTTRWAWLRLPEAWCLAGLVLFSIFLFSSTNGDIGIWGDDALFLVETGNVHQSYDRLVSSRGLLTPYYTFLYHLCGDDTATMHRLAFLLFAAGGFAGFGILRRYAGNLPALLAAMFFLSYPVRQDFLMQLSGGAYVVATLIFLASVYLATSERLSPWIKGTLIALINWVFVHLLEILLPVAPLYPLLEMANRRLKRRPVFTASLLPTFLPMLVLVFHMAIIYVATRVLSPTGSMYWSREAGFPHDLAGIVKWAWHVLWLGYETAVGRNYAGLMWVGLRGFVCHVPFTLTLCASGVGALAVVVLLIQRWRREPAEENGQGAWTDSKWLCLLTGAYLALFSHMVGVTIVADILWPRLLLMNCAGLAILFALTADAALRHRRARFLLPVMVLGVFAQGATLNSFFYEFQTKWAFESQILKQMVASGAVIRPGDRVFLSFPPPRLMREYWHVGFSQTEYPSFGLLLAGTFMKGAGVEAGSRINDFGYVADVREPGRNLVRFNPERAAMGGEGKFYPFYMRRENEKLYAIRKVNFRSLDGDLLSTLPFFDGVAVPPDMQTTVEAVTAVADEESVSKPMRLRLYLWQPGVHLEVEGVAESTSAPLRAEIRQNGRVLASSAARPGERFVLTVPTDALDRVQPITLHSTPTTGSAQAAWRVIRSGLRKAESPQ
jgi:hypothetical protein